MKIKSNDLCETNQKSGEIRTGIINLPSGPREVKYSVIDGLAIFEGDIILGTVEEMENSSLVKGSLEGMEDVSTIKGIGITGDQYRWPNGIIPFQIDSSLSNQQRVTDAISEWENRTFIRFVRRTNETNYVTFRPSSECSSHIGMQGGQQFINLGDNCTTGNAIHEIGHAVGLFHEQSREDRNNFVRINRENIESGQEDNFDQAIPISDDYGPYDYGSIMHYGRYFFSKNPGVLATIEPLNPLPPGVEMGQRNGLSDGDVAAVNALYHRIEPDPDGLLYAGIWEQRDGMPWQAQHGLTAVQYQETFDHLVAQGYRLTHISGYTVYGEDRYAAIWEQREGPRWHAHHGLTAEQYQQTFDELSAQGYRLVHISGYTNGGGDRYAAIWEQREGPRWHAHHGLTAEQYQQTLNELDSQGYRLIQVCGYGGNGTDRFAAIWEQRSGAAWIARHGLTSAQYQQTFNELIAQGYRLVCVSGYGLFG